ncbi:VOC family protein [uncultured Limosilactobacillus sp.]|uniref:VOC family protein n=1 Tax=uncultured Limosilactobacillus sp. TaxID=2837629 RepID=UPI0025CEA6FA|nr:VOC family protein [uncultured Limosilactobacillus sp.]
MRMRRFDDLTIYVSDLERSRRFYHEVFDMPIIEEQSDANHVTIRCGHQLIRLIAADHDHQSMVGMASFSIVARDNIDDISHHFISYEVKMIQPVHQALGAEGKMQAITIADPDNNIINVVVYQNK